MNITYKQKTFIESLLIKKENDFNPDLEQMTSLEASELIGELLVLPNKTIIEGIKNEEGHALTNANDFKTKEIQNFNLFNMIKKLKNWKKIQPTFEGKTFKISFTNKNIYISKKVFLTIEEKIQQLEKNANELGGSFLEIAKTISKNKSDTNRKKLIRIDNKKEFLNEEVSRLRKEAQTYANFKMVFLKTKSGDWVKTKTSEEKALLEMKEENPFFTYKIETIPEDYIFEEFHLLSDSSYGDEINLNKCEGIVEDIKPIFELMLSKIETEIRRGKEMPILYTWNIFANCWEKRKTKEKKEKIAING